MTVYKRPGSSVYHYEFVLKGKRYRGTTSTENKTQAVLYEAQQRKLAEETLANIGTRFETLGSLADRWLKEGETERRDIDNDRSRVRKLFGTHLVNGEEVKSGRFALSRDLRIDLLARSHLADLVQARRDEGNSGATINREIALLQALYGLAERMEAKLPLHPLRFKDYRCKENVPKRRFLSVEEEGQLMTAILDKRDRYKEGGPMWRMIDDQYLMTMLLLDTGARYDEIAKLTWDDIDFSGRFIRFHRSKTQNHGVAKMTVRVFGLLTLRFMSKDSGTYLLASWDRGDADADSPRGWATQGLQKTMDDLGFNTPEKVARYGRATAHTMRHTFASRLLQNGATLAQVQKLLGHSTPTMTNKYAHLDTQTAVQSAGILDSVHASASPNSA